VARGTGAEDCASAQARGGETTPVETPGDPTVVVMSKTELRKQAAQFIDEQAFLLAAELTSADALRARISALEPALAVEVVRQMKSRAARRSGHRTPSRRHLREQRTNPKTGTKYSLLDCRAPDSLIPESDGGRWAVVCDTHSSLLQFDSYAQARAVLAQPEEVCDICGAELEARARIAAGDGRAEWEIVRDILGPLHGYAPTGPAS